MRPVNLIPEEERSATSSRGPLRTGPAAYVITGALAVGLVMVIAMAMTSKSINDEKSKVGSLQQELVAATARAESLRPFEEFRKVQEARTSTVASLAQSRFDWERVMRELAITIPPDVWLIKMTGTVSPSVQIDGGAEVQIRDSVAGPALEIIGCAADQDDVAGFVAALEDIDGVTRVGLGASERPDDENAASTSSGAGTQDLEDCRTRQFIYQFEIVVAFDEVPAPPAATAPPAVPLPGSPSTSPASTLAEAGATTDPDTDSVAEQTGQAQQATQMIPGG